DVPEIPLCGERTVLVAGLAKQFLRLLVVRASDGEIPTQVFEERPIEEVQAAQPGKLDLPEQRVRLVEHGFPGSRLAEACQDAAKLKERIGEAHRISDQAIEFNGSFERRPCPSGRFVDEPSELTP